MKKVKNYYLLLFAALLFTFILPLQQISAATNNKAQVNYLALGDSLAAGYTPNNELGASYTDYLAEKAANISALHTYNKGFAVPGYTTDDVLKDINENVSKPIINLKGKQTETEAIQTAITNADIITISAGANDILQKVDINPDTGEIHADQTEIAAGLALVSSNLTSILTEINTLNPDAKVYVMGYYNPLPYLPAEVQELLNLLTNQLNTTIAGSLKGSDAINVNTKETIANNYQLYLPNPNNIHPSEQGYKKLAALFWTEMAEYPWIIEPTFGDVKENWAQLYVEESVDKGLIKGYTDGTFKPYNTLTRANAAAILSRALDLQAEAKAPFKDIDKYHVDTQMEISAAYEAGIIKGYDSGKAFKPNENVTRAQLALMIKRAFEYKEAAVIDNGAEIPFNDLDKISDEETLEAIALLASLDIISGSNNQFMPGNSTLRQQAAKMFVNTMDYLEAQ